ncbi:glycoside hydrolase family 88 protein [Maribacter polysiphoniae]|uniref:Glycoside hydrolase family 88 protein n=1 Tax=Maribacter polysiphoniae TaxID=429344 RepID=A0A316DWH6_9FLAO|nr:glycoside hydrolase family 76 protein [Maribacter polysiphoniae]MBD1262137.1 glycoside hydrolase family 88 protein [Maribacter polysiphoniae]PWK21828.1 putative alpha-1,6-mannanase (GH76 family) [Maribacter polysiphoniae]
MKIYTLLALMGITLLVSCSEDPVPLRDPVKGEEVALEIDWSATADSVQTTFYNTYLGSEGTFIANNSGDATFHYWPNAHVLNVLVDAYTRTGDGAYLSKMKNLVNGIETKNGGTYSNMFNDDMLWLGNAAVRAYEATGDPEYKTVAEFLWNDIILSHSDVFGGGITWKKDTPKQKNAVSNGPAIILAMRLYDIDKDTEYLDWAKSIYDWEKENLVDPITGLVWDNLSEENGEIITNKDWIFTYNAGTWIGANIRLYKETGEQSYLDDAIKTATSMMTSPKLTSNGLMKDEGQGDGGLFKGILVRYFTELILLQDINASDKEAFLDFFEYNANTLYSDGLKRPEMAIGPNWGEKPSGNVDLTTQLSGIMLVEAAAKLEKENFLE